jgi:Cu/Ag efflux pump CusA
MLHRLIEASLRQRTFLLIVAGVSLFIGAWSAFNLPIDAVPDITSPQVQVNTKVPALAPEETEKSVTIPLEMELAGIQGVQEMRSLTKFGLSQVTLIFQDRTDLYRARQLVAERLQTVAERLPAGLTPELAPISTGLGEIYYYHPGLPARCHQPPGHIPTSFANCGRFMSSPSNRCSAPRRASPKSTPTADTKSKSSFSPGRATSNKPD